MTVTGFDARTLALDLGTGRTRLASAGQPVFVEAPSTVDSPAQTKGSLAIACRAERPVEHGVVVDVDAAARMLAPHIRTGRGPSPWKPRVLACHPSDASVEERDRLVAAVLTAGAGAVRLAPEPVAALLGSAGVEVAATRPRLIVDLGEGVTDVAVVQDGRVLVSAAVRLGLGEIRRAVCQEVLKEHGVTLLSNEAQSLLVSCVSLDGWMPVTRAPRRRERARVDGRRVLRHLVLVSGAVVAHAMTTALDAISERASMVMRALDTRERSIIAADGILVSGGGALVPHLRHGIGTRTGIDVEVARNPLHAVVTGALRLLQEDGDDGWASDESPALVCRA